MKILVADDDAVSRMVLQAAVEQHGHDCLVAADGDEAWRLCVSSQPDVLIADRVMPGLDGLELCRRVRAHVASHYTYVILATSLGEREDVRDGMKAGADDYLTKPVDPFDLETRLLAASRVTALHAELAAYRAELARLASTDPLTGLGNRRSLENDLRVMHLRSVRYGDAYAVVLADVDHFKSYNDHYGHAAGDSVLRAVGAALRRETRDTDGVYRYGGEEFLLLLPEQDVVTGAATAERVRGAVEALSIPHAAGRAGGVVTISMGVAAFVPGSATTENDVVAAADAALYRAKDAGRNTVAS